MPSFNLAIKSGHLGSDPELKTLPSGARVCNVSLATQDTEKQTNWHRLVFWGPLAELLVANFKKGDYIMIFGKGRSGSYTNNSGIKVSTYDIQVDAFFDKSVPLAGGDLGDGGNSEDPPF